MAFLLWCTEIPGLNAYLHRRNYNDLIKNHMEGPKGFRAVLAPWVDDGLVQIVEKEIRFIFNGSKIFLCHADNEADIWQYQGSEQHVAGIDEGGQYTPFMLRFIRSRVRCPGLVLPEKYKGRFPRCLITANPGGPGHQYLKTNFIDPQPPEVVWQAPEDDGGMTRVFIPAKLHDNPSMAVDDPGYRFRLRALGGGLAKMMEDGDWDVVAGAYFTEIGPQHWIRPFEIPVEWTRFRSLDWGSARPFAVYWWAVSDGSLPQYPKGALVCYREWYGCTEPNVGLKLHVPAVAQGILERDRGEQMAYSVADPAIFQEDGGPCIAEQFAANGVLWRPADNKRIPGWQQLRDRLVGEDGKPMVYFFDTCVHLKRTLPALQHDDHKPEDVDTDLEDHGPDSARYALMSRPWVKILPEPKRSITLQNATFQDMLSAHLAGKKRHSLR